LKLFISTCVHVYCLREIEIIREKNYEDRCCSAHLRRSLSIGMLSYNFNLLYFLELFQTLLPKKYEYSVVSVQIYLRLRP
jgi:hypothetical protein